MKKTEDYSPNYSEDLIYFQKWEPDSGVKNGCMILIHGLGEHSQRYDGDFSNFWIDKGFTILTFDIPGFGRSSGKRGHLQKPEELFTILDDLIQSAKKEFTGKPIVIYGHSMGGEIALWYGLLQHPEISGLIASAPSIGPKDEVPKMKVFFAKLMDKIFPAFTMDNGLNTDLLSKDKKVVEAYRADPLVHRKVSARTGMMILDKGKWVLENAHINRNQILVMVASEEGLVNPMAIRKFCDDAPNVELKLWPGFFHELHNEPEYQTVMDYAYRWILNL